MKRNHREEILEQQSVVRCGLNAKFAGMNAKRREIRPATLFLLANELAGRPFGPTQLVALASRMEQDLGVSITGTQEQSNVVFGGVTDYVWFPWGLPLHGGGQRPRAQAFQVVAGPANTLARAAAAHTTTATRSRTAQVVGRPVTITS